MLPWQKNDAQLHLDITSALATRGMTSAPRCDPAPATDGGPQGSQDMAVVDAMTNLDTHKTELEEKAFDLVLKQLCYDVEVWHVHTQKCTDYEMAVQWQKHSWSVKRHRQSRAAAEAFLNQFVLVLKNSDPVVADPGGAHAHARLAQSHRTKHDPVA